jgi:hypothetical protein
VPLHLLGISRAADLHRWDRDGVRWIVQDDLAAAAVPPLPPSAGPLEHAALLAALYRRGDILPVRWATVLPDEQGVRDLLCRRRAGLLGDLDRLQGTGELGLRIELSHAPGPPHLPEPGASGRADSPAVRYLAARRARYQRQDRWSRRARCAAEASVRAVKGLYREWGRLSSEPPGTVRLAFLVERHLWDAFAERVVTSPARATGEQRTLLGPWPPYSFVSR